MPFSRPDPFLPGTHRTLVVLRFLLNTIEETDRIWPNSTTPCYLTNYSRSAETGEIFGLELSKLTARYETQRKPPLGPCQRFPAPQTNWLHELV